MTGVGIEDATEDGGAHRAGDTVGEAIQNHQYLFGPGVLQQQGAAGTAQLSHDGGRLQTAADTVADDDSDTAVGQQHGVVPVAADFQGAGGRFVADGETSR